VPFLPRPLLRAESARPLSGADFTRGWLAARADRDHGRPDPAQRPGRPDPRTCSGVAGRWLPERRHRPRPATPLRAAGGHRRAGVGERVASAARIRHRHATHRPSRSGTYLASRTCHASRIGARATATELGAAASEPSDCTPSAPAGIGRLTARASPCHAAGPPNARAARSTNPSAHVGGAGVVAHEVLPAGETRRCSGLAAVCFSVIDLAGSASPRSSPSPRWR
jgi:hypothetical protein